MILTDLSKFDAYMFNLLVNKIKNTKSQYDADLANEEWALKGSRYNDNERIARMVVGNIYGECGFDYEKANAKFISLNSIEIEPYIKAAVLDSASADYYYTYEKQW
jgi:6-pyruvoyl-tetrahydropterin synthase